MANRPDAAADPVDVAVGARIRLLRKVRGLSQQALAEAVGVTFRQIQKYERGAHRVSAAMLSRIASALDVPKAEVLGENSASSGAVGTAMAGAGSVERLVAAFNAHDAAAFSAAFTSDGVMYEFPDQAVGRGRDQIRDYIGKMFAALPAAKVKLLGRIDLGLRQITHERFDRGDGSATYEAGLVYTLSEDGISRLDFVREDLAK